MSKESVGNVETKYYNIAEPIDLEKPLKRSQWHMKPMVNSIKKKPMLY